MEKPGKLDRVGILKKALVNGHTKKRMHISPKSPVAKWSTISCKLIEIRKVGTKYSVGRHYCKDDHSQDRFLFDSYSYPN